MIKYDYMYDYDRDIDYYVLLINIIILYPGYYNIATCMIIIF